jgi:hypothetical protein
MKLSLKKSGVGEFTQSRVNTYLFQVERVMTCTNTIQIGNAKVHKLQKLWFGVCDGLQNVLDCWNIYSRKKKKPTLIFGF